MPRAGITLGRVTATGAELADEIGFEHVTVAEVARRLGVRTPSLYSHVASSADLSVRISLLALDELAVRASDATVGKSRFDALMGLADAYRGYAREHPGRFAATLVPLDAETAAASAGPRHARLLEAILDGYDLDPAARVHAIRLIGSTIRGFITLERGGSFDHSSPDADTSWHEILRSLDTLITTWTDHD
ncbi:AcrR family transcriptional regulator [Microbacteriaceae bacterium SG_E_30_P1]|uniref:AcrR family transcriptional regulator n=1 Tax=Antiquaquibacter oligotrophicus TaxID=2880260 RepID=A0ABT6KQX7_9MICO|nr:TetR-like C-terminal domain-containing protein [Antiquaquibacter oligotrophicus]MDH6181512.1 AcrR family transcriptional regulator [Antiquaquibacter oligotrophicus]UDF12798.1 TetR/AcrR family transcriptional regulator [Antiquaquibacter oligotrophicus]